MKYNRRQLMTALAAGLAWGTSSCQRNSASGKSAETSAPAALRNATGSVDWQSVRNLFPLRRDWIHLASFLLVSHPKPISDAIQHFRGKIDEDPTWIERAAFSDSEGKPFAAIKRALAGYIGGDPSEICLTSNTTTALAMAYHGLRIRKDQEILTTEHDHYSQHESIRFASARSGCGVRYVALYDRASAATASEMVDRIAAKIRPATRAIGITWVHSSTGVKVPVAAIAEAVSHANKGRPSADRCLLIVDGVHGFANQDVEVARLGCDFFASGTHKWLFAPRGTGFLWGRKDVWPELRPTIPTFDPDAPQPWDAWMERKPLPPTEASFISPGGFLAFEQLLGIPAAVELHRSIGRDHIAARIRELNSAFRQNVAKIPGLTLHTPTDPEVSAGISCFEVDSLKPDEVEMKLAARNFRTSSSPYKISYARVAAGIMNTPDEIEAVLRELHAISPRAAAG